MTQQIEPNPSEAVPAGGYSTSPQDTPLTGFDAEPAALTLRQLTNVWGDSGTYRYGGFFYEEPNEIMRDQQRWETIETMRRTDGAVKAALNAIKAPLLATVWRVEGEDKEIVDFVEDSLFHMKRSWKDFLREALGYLDFGFYCFEIIWEPNGEKLIIADLAPRIPHSIFRFRMSSGQPGITQIIRTDEFKKSYAEIPVEKLVILTNDKEGDDITGQSVLRAAYKHFHFKDTLYRIQGIGAERNGIGIPVIKMPPGFGAQDKAKAEEIVRNMRTNETAFVVLPSKEWEIDILTPKADAKGATIIDGISHHNNMILMSVLASFLGLGQDGVGSLALSKDLSSFFLKHVEDKACYFAEQITEQVIKKMVMLNFGPDADIPELKFNPLGDIDFKEMSEVLLNLVNAGLIRNDTKLTQFTHEMFKLPEISDADVDAIAEPDAVRQEPDSASGDAEKQDAYPDGPVNQPSNLPIKGASRYAVGPFNPAAVEPALDPANGPAKTKIGNQTAPDNAQNYETKQKTTLSECPRRRYKAWAPAV